MSSDKKAQYDTLKNQLQEVFKTAKEHSYNIQPTTPNQEAIKISQNLSPETISLAKEIFDEIYTAQYSWEHELGGGSLPHPLMQEHINMLEKTYAALKDPSMDTANACLDAARAFKKAYFFRGVVFTILSLLGGIPLTAIWWLTSYDAGLSSTSLFYLFAAVEHSNTITRNTTIFKDALYAKVAADHAKPVSSTPLQPSNAVGNGGAKQESNTPQQPSNAVGNGGAKQGSSTPPQPSNAVGNGSTKQRTTSLFSKSGLNERRGNASNNVTSTTKKH